MVIKSEKGFTLLELIMVLAIFAVFSTAMMSLLITMSKMSTYILQENKAKSVVTLALPHMERSIREHEQTNAIKIRNFGTTNPVLEINTDPGVTNSMKLYYFYEPSEKSIYFQAATTLTPSDKAKSIKLVEKVEDFDVSLQPAKKTIRLSIDVKSDTGVKNYVGTIALKTY